MVRVNARQQQPDRGLSRERAMRERRIARAEDAVRRHVLVEFLLERRRDVNVGEHAEAIFGRHTLGHSRPSRSTAVIQ